VCWSPSWALAEPPRVLSLRSRNAPSEDAGAARRGDLWRCWPARQPGPGRRGLRDVPGPLEWEVSESCPITRTGPAVRAEEASCGARVGDGEYPHSNNYGCEPAIRTFGAHEVNCSNSGLRSSGRQYVGPGHVVCEPSRKTVRRTSPGIDSAFVYRPCSAFIPL